MQEVPQTPEELLEELVQRQVHEGRVGDGLQMGDPLFDAAGLLPSALFGLAGPREHQESERLALAGNHDRARLDACGRTVCAAHLDPPLPLAAGCALASFRALVDQDLIELHALVACAAEELGRRPVHVEHRVVLVKDQDGIGVRLEHALAHVLLAQEAEQLLGPFRGRVAFGFELLRHPLPFEIRRDPPVGPA